jgi:hypothetical protein
MGFFKDLKNKVTGGAATVRVTAPPTQRGRAVPVQVQATAKTNGKVVRATESCAFKHNNEKVSSAKVSYETRVQVAGAQDIKEGETYNWEGQIELPINTNPTLRGSLIDHTWEIQAGLDMPGNDPDSGWQTFDVS